MASGGTKAPLFLETETEAAYFCTRRFHTRASANPPMIISSPTRLMMLAKVRGRDGGRTGLTSLTTGILFLLAIVLAPVAGIVPSAATAPALIIVGVFMMKGVLKVDWSDMETAIPCFLTIAMMPFAYSIADGIGFGIISYTLIKLARGKAKEVPVLMYILSALFILSYILLATTAA